MGYGILRHKQGHFKWRNTKKLDPAEESTPTDTSRV
jgi:hypothetical protein